MSMTIAIDFDGVISDFSKGWQGVEKFGPPLPGAKEALIKLREAGHKIIIFTCREDNPFLQAYLEMHGIPYDAINTNSWDEYSYLENESRFVKPHADVYIDDRAVTFRGDWDETLKELEDFEPWHKKR